MEKNPGDGFFSFVKDKYMDNKNKADNNREQVAHNPSTQKTNNPFENNRTVENDIQESQEELENEQTFKEASTERD